MQLSWWSAFIATPALVVGLGLLSGCERNPAVQQQPTGALRSAAAPSSDTAAARTPSAAVASARDSAPLGPAATASHTASALPWVVDRQAYAWLADPQYAGPEPTEPLEARFAPPAGFVRVPVAAGSFGAWLRELPLAKPATAVKSYRGQVLYAADDPRIGAVIAIDVGSADLQQCADAVVRLHAEWRWSQGHRDHSYRAASGTRLGLERFARGERIVADGTRLRWMPRARPSRGHAAFRQYLDTVFAWANTVSIGRQALPVSAEAVAAGDFFVLGGNPGHAVLVLDLARAEDGRQVALLGQSYMPAQNLYVLRPGAGRVWFVLDRGRDVVTPFWRPFPWSSLRRLPG
jgi:hypothetical protein